VATYTQDPDDVLDYQIDWTTFLAAGETISSYTVTSSAATFIVDNDSEASGVITYWASGGTAGDNYRVTFHNVTSAGREKDASDTFRIREQ
jgi:hypothetical protein